MKAMDGADDDGAAGRDRQCTCTTSGGHAPIQVVIARALHTRAKGTKTIQVAAASLVHKTSKVVPTAHAPRNCAVGHVAGAHALARWLPHRQCTNTTTRWLPRQVRSEIARWAMSPVHMH